MSVSAEAALHLCVLLAAVPQRAIAAGDLAEFHALAPAATAKLLQQLTAAGIVEAHTGRGGGYALARSPDQITVAEIVSAAGGVAPGFRCNEIRRKGPCADKPSAYLSRCAIAGAMDEAESAWWEVLNRRTLASLAGRVAGQVPETRRVRTRDWLLEKARPA
jgi:Rrf2 family protein